MAELEIIPPSHRCSPLGRHCASSNYSSWGNRVSWTRLIPVVARPLGRHTELTRRSVFMDQARPDIPRKRRQIVPSSSLSLSPFFSLFSLRLFASPRLASPRRCFFFLLHGGGLINETGQARHYYLLYSARRTGVGMSLLCSITLRSGEICRANFGH